MPSVIVHLLSALICFDGHCYPTLVGSSTPTGDFPLVHVETKISGYGGDVLAFAQDDSGVYAIHRVWTLAPQQHRVERLQVAEAAERRNITAGCINVMPTVYDALVDCCSHAHVIITN